MKNFAVMSGTTVINVVASETKEDAEFATNSQCIEYTTENPAGINWTYADGVFTPPVEETPSE